MMHHPKEVLEHMARIGRQVIVAIPNFGYWKNRWYLMTKGRMPVTEELAYEWYETPNIHFCTIRDFITLAEEVGLVIDERYSLDSDGYQHRFRGKGRMANLFSEKGVFLLSARR